MQPQQPQYQQQPYPQGGQWQQQPTMPVGAPQQPAPYFQQQPMMAPPPPPPKKKSMVWKVLGGLAAGVIAFAAVGSFLAPDRDPSVAASSDREQSGSERREARAAEALPEIGPYSRISTPDEAGWREYLATLTAIEPGLTVHTARAMRRGVGVCDRILHPADGTMTVEEYTVEALSGGQATIDEEQAAKVIEAVKVWCRPA